MKEMTSSSHWSGQFRVFETRLTSDTPGLEHQCNRVFAAGSEVSTLELPQKTKELRKEQEKSEARWEIGDIR